MAFRFNPITGNLDLVGDTTGGGDVFGPSSSDNNAIARYNGTTGKIIKNSPGTVVQDSGAIESQGFITNRIVSGTVAVSGDETWIAPSLEVASGGIIQLGAGGQLIIV